MTSHSALTGSDLHVPKGVSPTALNDIPDNTANAIRWQEGSNDLLAIDTTNGSEVIRLGNATTNPDVTIVGSGKFTAAGAVVQARKTITNGTTAGTATDCMVEVNSSGGAVIYQTEAPATFGAGRTVWFQDVGGVLHVASLTIDQDAGGNLNGADAPYVVTVPYASFGIYCDGSNFYVRS